MLCLHATQATPTFESASMTSKILMRFGWFMLRITSTSRLAAADAK
jgi:hypothetical protein